MILLLMIACQEKTVDSGIEIQSTEATLRLLSAIDGSNQEGVTVSSTFDNIETVTEANGRATVIVQQSSNYHLYATNDDAMPHVYQGFAGEEPFEVVGYIVDRQSTEMVFSYLGTEMEPGKGIVVAALDYPNLQPVYGASATLDDSNDAFIFGNQSLPEAGNQLVQGGSSFVFFPNINPGTANITITPPDNVSCRSFPMGNQNEGLTIDVYADSVSIAVFQCTE